MSLAGSLLCAAAIAQSPPPPETLGGIGGADQFAISGDEEFRLRQLATNYYLESTG